MTSPSSATFERRHAAHDDITYSFSVANETAPKTILIIHGVSGGKEDMELMGELAVRRGYAVYLLDLPNHGSGSYVEVKDFEGMAEWLHQAIQAIGIVPDILVGNSYASAICYTYVAMGLLPAHTKLILNCPTPDVAFASATLGHILVRLPGNLPARVYNSRPLIFARVNYLSRQRGDGSKELLRQSELRKIGALDVRVGVRMANLIHSHNPYRRFQLPEEVQRRTVVVIGDRDNVVTSRSIDTLRQLLPYAKFDIVRGAGHILHFEAPDSLGRHIEDI